MWTKLHIFYYKGRAKVLFISSKIRCNLSSYMTISITKSIKIRTIKALIYLPFFIDISALLILLHILVKID